MKNYEKYADEIKGYDGFNFCTDFIVPHVLKSDDCSNNCSRCKMLQTIWLLGEYEEPEIDWSKVKVDTPILVRDSENTEWLKKHFAKYEDGIVYVWNLGRTSWTAPHDKSVSAWRYAKLIEDEKEHKESEVDWNKIKVDTPILVKNSEDEMWRKRHFAKYKNGNVYAWSDGLTSWTAYDRIVWRYAKLVESEEECKDSEVDWSKVEVDTPILVRVFEGERWKKRYFAKVEDGFVYAWTGENTSLTANGMTRWSYAKLAESEE